MPSQEFLPPLKGILKGAASDKAPQDYSEYMVNCRPIDVLEKKIRIGQRPGLDKWGAGTLIGGENQPVVAMCVVNTVV